ncbi:MAG: hypothetical protein RMJ15_03450 [Nitrososphaerota archaeon]|nr:hypothetical protein [Nitrososphaerota archaeon]
MKLECWQEIVGRLEAVKDNGDGTVTLVFTAFSGTLEVTVSGEVEAFKPLINATVGVLRTDDVDKPYRVRMVDGKGGWHLEQAKFLG